MANDAKDAATGTAKESSSGGAVPVRWPWLAMGLAGLLIPLLWLVLGRSDGATGGGGHASMPSAPMAAAPAARPNIRLEDRETVAEAPAEEAKASPAKDPAPEKSSPAERKATASPRQPEADGLRSPPRPAVTRERSAPVERETTKAPRAAKGKAPSPPAPAKPMADPVAAGPLGPPVEQAGALPPAPPPPSAAPGALAPPPPPAMAPGAVAGVAMAPKPAPPKPAAPKPAPANRRSVEAMEDGDADLAPSRDDAPPAKQKTAQRSGPAPSNRGEGIGLGNTGTLGHGAVSRPQPTGMDAKPRVAKSGQKKKSEAGVRTGKGRRAFGQPTPPPSPEPSTEGAEGEEEADSEVASLKPGWFGAKIPEQMNLNESTRVRVTVTREENKAKGKAKLEAMPPTHLPAKVVEQDILVGKFLRVELRAFASEFEILPITPPEQRLIAGRVTTWEWAVVPRQAGPHELSVVVTNLTDGRGNPIDLTVHSVSVEVQVKTMQRLKDVASLLSSAMGGLMSLLGMYKGVVAPLLNRRREKDGEAGKDKSKDKSKDPPKEKDPDSPEAGKPDGAVAATSPEGSKPAS